MIDIILISSIITLAFSVFLICARQNASTLYILAQKHPIRLVSFSHFHLKDENTEEKGIEITCPQSHSTSGIWNQQFGSRVCECQDTPA